MIQLYDKSTIDHLPWPLTYDGQYAKHFLKPLVKEGVGRYVDNIQTDLFVLSLDSLVLPVTINDGQYNNSYVCSPFTQYISYCIDELYLVKNRIVKSLLGNVLHGLGRLLKWGKINKVVIINNWLVSTNLYPEISKEQVKVITAFITHRYPEHFILWRSLSQPLNQKLMSSLKEIGYLAVGGRAIYLFDPKSEQAFTKENLKHDLRLLRKGYHKIVSDASILEGYVKDIKTLYDQLYLNKYSLWNPAYNERFFKLMIEKKLLEIKVLKKDGIPKGVLGYFKRNGVMTTPLFGYDLNLPKKEGLYRSLSTILALDAKELGLILHSSSGAGEFKRSRGAVQHIEYNFFYGKHLHFGRRFVLRVLQWIANGMGIHMLKKFG